MRRILCRRDERSQRLKEAGVVGVCVAANHVACSHAYFISICAMYQQAVGTIFFD